MTHVNKRLRLGYWLLAAALLSACATRAVDVKPTPADPRAYETWTCDALLADMDRVQQRAADVAYAVDARAGNNMIALSVGVLVFWPALLAMRSDGLDAVELGRLHGRFEAMKVQFERKQCPPPSEWLPPQRAARLPIAIGERLVYEERETTRGIGRELVLTVGALKRTQIEYQAEVGGRQQPAPWVQDLAGNLALPAGAESLVYWGHLLRHELSLGEVLSGELFSTQGSRARMRGQVIALGVKTGFGRPFDAVVVELFGDVYDGGVPGRVEGVIVVDRASGVLLRLELRSGNPEFALRRTLVRIDPAR